MIYYRVEKPANKPGAPGAAGESEAARPPALRAVLLHLAIIAVLVALAYSNTFQVPLMFDDAMYLEYNPIVRDPSYMLDIGKSQRITLESDITRTLRTRMTGYLSFLANYMLHGHNVVGYHATNILIHLSASVLVYFLALYIFTSPLMRGSPLCERAALAALCAALLFGLHPVQTQAVTYITQRFASLAGMFSILTAALYMKYRLSGRRRFLVLSIAGALLAAHSKENVFTLPLALAALEFALFEGAVRRRLPALLLVSAPFALIPLYSVLGNIAVGFGGKFSDAMATQDVISRHEYFLTSLRVVATYLRLLLLPYGQNVDYDYPLSRSLGSTEALAILFHVSVLALAIWGIVRARKKGGRHVALAVVGAGVVWFYVLLAVENSVVSLADVIFEHRLYLPSVGIFIGASAVAFSSMQRTRDALLSVATAALILGFMAYERNDLWRSPLTLWEDIVEKSPNKARAHENYAHSLQQERHLWASAVEYDKVIALDPTNPLPYNNSALLFMEMKMHREAEAFFLKAIELQPMDALFRSNLAGFYIALDRFEEGIILAQEALKLKEEFLPAYVNLCAGSFYAGHYVQALDYCKKGIEIEPENPDFIRHIALTYDALGREEEAIETFKKAIELKPGDADSMANLAALYFFRGNYEEAARHYRRSLETRKPNFIVDYTNLAAAYRMLKKYDEAVSTLKDGIKAYPKHQPLRIALAQTYDSMGLHEEAVKVLENSLLEQGLSGSSLQNYMAARAARSVKDYDAAARYLWKILKAIPDFEQGYYELAQVTQLKGDLAGALKYYKKAMSYSPEKAAYHNHLGIVYSRLDRYAESIEEFNKAIKLEPANYGYRRNLFSAIKQDSQGQAKPPQPSGK